MTAALLSRNTLPKVTTKVETLRSSPVQLPMEMQWRFGLPASVRHRHESVLEASGASGRYEQRNFVQECYDVAPDVSDWRAKRAAREEPLERAYAAQDGARQPGVETCLSPELDITSTPAKRVAVEDVFLSQLHVLVAANPLLFKKTPH